MQTKSPKYDVVLQIECLKIKYHPCHFKSWELKIFKNLKVLGKRQIRDLNNLVQVNDVFSKLYRYGLINPSYDLVSDTVTIDIQGQFVYLF